MLNSRARWTDAHESGERWMLHMGAPAIPLLGKMSSLPNLRRLGEMTAIPVKIAKWAAEGEDLVEWLFKQFSDNETFRRWLSDAIFRSAYG